MSKIKDYMMKVQEAINFFLEEKEDGYNEEDLVEYVQERVPHASERDILKLINSDTVPDNILSRFV